MSSSSPPPPLTNNGKPPNAITACLPVAKDGDVTPDMIPLEKVGFTSAQRPSQTSASSTTIDDKSLGSEVAQADPAQSSHVLSERDQLNAVILASSPTSPPPTPMRRVFKSTAV